MTIVHWLVAINSVLVAVNLAIFVRGVMAIHLLRRRIAEYVAAQAQCNEARESFEILTGALRPILDSHMMAANPSMTFTTKH